MPQVAQDVLVAIAAPRITKNPLTRTALLAVVAAVATIALKSAAYFVTGSVSLLSDAVESTANLLAAMTALFAVWYAARPIDRNHNYGHEKVEFFASGLEGTLILIAAGGIAYVAIERLLNPQPIEGFGLGVVIAVVASLINLVAARLLITTGRAHQSIALEADGRHLMTDVVTSAGVVIGLVLVRLTGYHAIDPLLALLVAANVLWTGFSLIRVSIDGLMDTALPERELHDLRQAIEERLEENETYHALRTRRAGSRKFVDFHLLVPGDQSVQRAHEITHRLEDAVNGVLPGAETTVHIEPIEDPSAWDDSPLVPIEQQDHPFVAAGHRETPISTV
jgi:cation diffusion facilitator family transporter